MSIVPETIRAGISNPRLVVPYVRRQALLARALARASSAMPAALHVFDLLSGSERLRAYLESNEEARYVECDVLDFRMWVDLLDEGLSRDLLVDGVREPLATTRYREELARLEARRGGLTVVDIGANIGYFALQYLAASDEDGRVIAIEPIPGNFALLEENARLNGVEDAIECHRRAIGAESRLATMQMSRYSNLAAVSEIATKPHYIDTVDVPMTSMDEFLQAHDVPFEAVDVLRMDLQGYEYEVFRGMTWLLREGDVGLAFVEIHPWALKADGNYDRFLSLLQEAGFEPTFVADGRTAVLHAEKDTYAERELEVNSLDELRDIEFTVEAILRR